MVVPQESKEQSRPGNTDPGVAQACSNVIDIANQLKPDEVFTKVAILELSAAIRRPSREKSADLGPRLGNMFYEFADMLNPGGLFPDRKVGVTAPSQPLLDPESSVDLS